MELSDRLLNRYDELLRYRAHLNEELAKCNAVLGEFRAILDADVAEEEPAEVVENSPK